MKGRADRPQYDAGMSSLKDRFRADLTAAIKAGDKVRSTTLRAIMTSVSNAEVAGKEHRELSDEDLLSVLATEAKKRRESATAYSEAGRPELAEKEEAEAAVIVEYLPAQLSAEEIRDLVSATISETGADAEGMKAMGKVMGRLQPRVKGRADGGAVAAEVKRQLMAG